jgi:hypothetical protein
VKKHYNKRWLEQRLDARQSERLERIRLKRILRAKGEEREDEPEHNDNRMLQDFEG